MSAFIDCMVCRARLIHPELTGHVSDTEFKKWARQQGKGWTVGPTRCPEHKGAAGNRLTEAALISRNACEAEHDPTPWVTYVGIAMAQTTFNAGGSSTGRASLSIRPEFCQEPSHYWLLDHLTVPSLAALKVAS